MAIPSTQDILKRISGSKQGATTSPTKPTEASAVREVDFRYGGQYNLTASSGENIRSPRGYGGFETKKGYQRDHIFPVSLGGTSNAANIHYLEMEKALIKDNVVRYAARKVKAGEMPIGVARMMVMNWENEDIPGQKAYSKRFGGPQNLASNFLKSFPTVPFTQ